MSTEYPNFDTQVPGPNDDTVVLDPDELRAIIKEERKLIGDPDPAGQEPDPTPTLEFSLEELSGLPHTNEKPAALEMLRDFTKHKEPYAPRGIRFARIVTGFGSAIWQQRPTDIRKRVTQVVTGIGDIIPPQAISRNIALGLGGAVLSASVLTVGVLASDSHENHEAQRSPTTNSPIPSAREAVPPAMIPENSEATPASPFPSPTGLPGKQDEGVPISIPHPPISRKPIDKTTSQQPHPVAAPVRPQQENPAITRPATEQNAAEMPAATPNTPAPSRTSPSIPRPEQPTATSAPSTKTPPATPSVQPPRTTSSPTSSESPTTSKPSVSATQSPSKPSSTSETGRPNTTQPSSRPSKTATARETTALPSPKQTITTSPQASFSATDVPPAETLKPTTTKPSNTPS